MTMTAGSASVHEAPLNHHREGSGPPLVLIHGVGHQWQGWQPTISLLAQEFDVLACDSPGFGASAPLATGVRPNIDAYADAFEQFFATIGLDRPHVAGNSMGGGIAIELLRRGSVRSATAFSPVGFWTDAERRRSRLMIRTLGSAPSPVRAVLLAVQRSTLGRRASLGIFHGYPERIPTHASQAAIRALASAPALHGALDAFEDYRFSGGEDFAGKPLTIAWGNRDRLLPYRSQFPRAVHAVPTARHVTLGAGHLPAWDDPAAVAATIALTARDAITLS